MTAFQAVFFLVLGTGLALVPWWGLRVGWLPCGPRRFGQDIRVWREERPVFFWVLFCGYGIAGLWMLGFALRLIAGSSEPLPLS